MSLKEDINKNSTVLLAISNDNYSNILVNTIKKIMNSDKICYITLSKGYDALVVLLSKNKIKLDNFYFIDSITKTVKPTKDLNNCIFVSSPNSLTELSLAINKAVKKQNSKYIIFDSLSTLLIYHKDNIVSKFVQSLANKFETTGSNLIFTMTTKDKESALFKNIPLFINKIIDL